MDRDELGRKIEACFGWLKHDVTALTSGRLSTRESEELEMLISSIKDSIFEYLDDYFQNESDKSGNQ